MQFNLLQYEGVGLEKKWQMAQYKTHFRWYPFLYLEVCHQYHSEVVLNLTKNEIVGNWQALVNEYLLMESRNDKVFWIWVVS